MTIYIFICVFSMLIGFPGGSDGKESACNAGDPDSILGSSLGSPRGENGYALQYFYLKNSPDRGAWQKPKEIYKDSRSDFYRIENACCWKTN